VAGEAAGARGREQRVEQVGAQPRQQCLRLRVAEADVELDHARTVGGQHQAAVEDAVKRRAAVAHQLDDRLVDRRHQLRGALRVDLGDRRVGAHAAGVGSLVAVEDPLVIAGGRHRDRALTIAEREQRELLALEVLLDDDRLRAEAMLDEEGFERRARRGLVGGDHDALAGGQAVGLQHRGVALDRGEPVRHRARLRPGGGRHAGLRHRLLGELLRALQPCRRGARAERGDAVLAQAVGEAGDQRRLGADDDQIDVLVRGEPEQAVDVVGGEVDQPRVGGDAGVAGGAEQSRVLWRAGERADQRVLAPARADDENLWRGHHERSIRLPRSPAAMRYHGGSYAITYARPR
jgi:hypothetical protein